MLVIANVALTCKLKQFVLFCTATKTHYTTGISTSQIKENSLATVLTIKLLKKYQTIPNLKLMIYFNL